jgi:hypothetical protein
VILALGNSIRRLSPQSVSDTEARTIRQGSFDRVHEHYSSGSWAQGHEAWEQYVRKSASAEAVDPPRDTLRDFSRTGQARGSWQLFISLEEGDMAEVVDIARTAAASGHTVPSVVGW